MKHIILSITVVIALILGSCGAKEESKKVNNNEEFIDETTDTTDNIDYEAVVDNGLGEEFEPADSSSVETMNYTENTEEVLVKETEEPKEVKKEPKVHQVRYYIVVGSFTKFKNAKSLSTFFKKKGYYPLILPKSNNYNRVAISSFVEKPNAKKAISKLKNEYNDLTFWIYKW